LTDLKGLLSSSKYKLKEDGTSTAMSAQTTQLKTLGDAIEGFDQKKKELEDRLLEAEKRVSTDKERYKGELELKLAAEV
jgi:hypothetical protein